MPTLDTLRDPAALDALLGVVVDVLLRQPVRTLAAPDAWSGRAVEVLRHVSQDAAVRARVVVELDAARAALRAERRPVSAHLPSEAVQVVDRLAALPWTPSRELTLAVLRHDAVRALLREVLSGTVASLVARLRSTTAAIPRPLPTRGLLGGLAATVGSAAEGLAAAASREIDARVSDRLDGFVDGAVEGALEAIATWIADPRHEAASAALRRSAVGVVLARPVGALVAELDEVGSDALAAAVLDDLRGDDLAAVAGALLDPLGELAVADLVLRVGGVPLLDRVRAGAVDALRPSARAVVDSGAFAAWWASHSS